MAGNFFVDGAVRRPGSYPIRNKIVISEALLTTGGIAPYALKDSLMLIRNVEGSGRKIIELKFNKPDHQEMEVQDGAIIIVKTSTWGKMVHVTGIIIGIPGLIWGGYHDPERQIKS
ncbi:MAG: hypothetical protein BBJ57_00030 [Desulfobacterales bacterium PC51MH44]|nr:MAG: hypothetical protein BBJ57_00030 [Desulfobacterales bacterium PC51MH44]